MSDWSSGVCSSDLGAGGLVVEAGPELLALGPHLAEHARPLRQGGQLLGRDLGGAEHRPAVLLGGLHEVLQGLRGGLVLPAGQQQAAGRGARNGSSLAEKNAALPGCSPGCRTRSGRFRTPPSIDERSTITLQRQLPQCVNTARRAEQK